MVKYNGPIKNKRDADKLRKTLEGSDDPQARDAAKMLKRNWQSIAARPSLGHKMLLLAALVA